MITCSSTVDLSNDFLNKRNIPYVSFHYELNGTYLTDDLGLTVSSKDFYQKMREGVTTKTAQVNAEEYVNFFTPFLKQGYDILHVELSSGLSGSLNSATIAVDMLKEDFPDRKILLVDSLSASAGYGLLVDNLSSLKAEGLSIDELKTWAENNKRKVNHWFYSTDLSYYVKGGRISSTAGFVGSILSLCPVLNVDNLGKLTPQHKVIGKKRAINKVVDQMIELAQDKSDYNGKCFISHADCMEDAMAVAAKIEKAFPKLNGKVEIFDVGTTIGSHTGPGTLALFFFGDHR
jgi:DegV family protein with EDD domain